MKAPLPATPLSGLEAASMKLAHARAMANVMRDFAFVDIPGGHVAALRARPSRGDRCHERSSRRSGQDVDARSHRWSQRSAGGCQQCDAGRRVRRRGRDLRACRPHQRRSGQRHSRWRHGHRDPQPRAAYDSEVVEAFFIGKAGPTESPAIDAIQLGSGTTRGIGEMHPIRSGSSRHRREGEGTRPSSRRRWPLPGRRPGRRGAECSAS